MPLLPRKNELFPLSKLSLTEYAANYATGILNNDRVKKYCNPLLTRCEMTLDVRLSIPSSCLRPF